MDRVLAAALLLAAQCLAQSGAPEPPLRFGVIGDSGTGGSGQKRVAAQMVKVNAEKRWEFVLMLGDNIYETGKPSDFERKFKRIYRPLMDAGVKFHATLGNHDTVHPDAKKGMVQVNDPAFGYVGSQDEYVFEAGPAPGGRRLARFLTINSEAWMDAIAMENEGELKYRKDRLTAWLDEAADYRWNILFLHHPLYSYTQGPILGFISRGHGPETELREVLEPLLVGKVDIVLAGHEHFFQKILPQKGIHYIVSGGGGKVRKGAIRDPEYVEYAESTLHFLDVSLDSNSFRYRAIDSNGREIFTSVISKPATGGLTENAEQSGSVARTK